MSRDSDEPGPDRLLLLARQGDEAARGAQLEHYRHYLELLARLEIGRRLQTKVDTADVVQDTFMNALLKSERYDASKGAVLSYLLGTARHLMLRRLSNSREFASEELDFIDHETPLDNVARQETIDVVRAAVQSLPAAHREVIVLCELEEMDYTEAAAVLQCPIGTVRSRLNRARTMLTALMTKAWVR